MPSILQLEKLLAADPNDAFVLYGLAMEHAKVGQIERAIEFFDRCLACDPAYCYAYFHKARVLGEAGQPDRAIEALRAGQIAARGAGDSHAAAKMQDLLDQLE